jgi:YD repeat-containing protein
MSYDDDGNLLADAVWNYTWNGENRLVSMETVDKRLEFTYDYMGRRIHKKVYTGSTGDWQLVAHYEYSPFGKVTKTIGNGNIQPFKFSSEYHDNEIGLFDCKSRIKSEW